MVNAHVVAPGARRDADPRGDLRVPHDQRDQLGGQRPPLTAESAHTSASCKSGDISAQIDPIGVPRLMIDEDPAVAQNGGYLVQAADQPGHHLAS